MSNITVVTGTRAEFGLLQPIMQAIVDTPSLRLTTVVTGLHHVTGSRQDIVAGGFEIHCDVTMQVPHESGRWGDAAAFGRGVTGCAEAFGQLSSDCVLVLGDRIEALAAASAASVAGICLGHLHGGDRACGVADEAMRHAITKLANLHFPATPASARRILAMGEPINTIHIVGSPAMDGLDDIPAADDGPEVIGMLHPVGDSDTTERRRMAMILEATRPYDRVVMLPNRDPGHQGIRDAIEHERSQHELNVIDHLPRAAFVSMLKSASVLIGNSSAGLIECPAVGTPSINIGLRQYGRESPPSVTHIPHATVPAISDALTAAMSRPRDEQPQHPYGTGECGQLIAAILSTIDFSSFEVRKYCTY